jgi:mRNA interferase MazF
LILTSKETVFKKGDVVNSPFPFSEDVEETKDRHVLVLAEPRKGEFLCIYMTTKSHRDGAIEVLKKDYKICHQVGYDPSFIDPGKVATISSQLFTTTYGTLKDEIVDRVVESLVDLLKKPPQIPQTSPTFERPTRPKKPF